MARCVKIPRAVGLRVSLARGWVKRVVRWVKRLVRWVERLVRWVRRLVWWARGGGGPEDAVYTFNALTAILTFLYYVLAVHFFTVHEPQGTQTLHMSITQPLIYLYDDTVYKTRPLRLAPSHPPIHVPRTSILRHADTSAPSLGLARRLISSRSSSPKALTWPPLNQPHPPDRYISSRPPIHFLAFIEPQGAHMASTAPTPPTRPGPPADSFPGVHRRPRRSHG